MIVSLLKLHLNAFKPTLTPPPITCMHLWCREVGRSISFLAIPGKMKTKGARDSTGIESMVQHNDRPGRSKLAFLSIALRLLALMSSISGLVVMATDKQMSSSAVYIPFLKASLNVRKMAYYSLFMSFRFLVWANGIAAMVALSELIVQVAFAKQSNTVGWAVLLSDQVIAYLLMAAAAASSDVAYISKNGLDYIGWMEHCSYYSRFCSQAGISLVLTYFSMLIFAIQSMLSAHQLFTSMAFNT